MSRIHEATVSHGTIAATPSAIDKLLAGPLPVNATAEPCIAANLIINSIIANVGVGYSY